MNLSLSLWWREMKSKECEKRWFVSLSLPLLFFQTHFSSLTLLTVFSPFSLSLSPSFFPLFLFSLPFPSHSFQGTKHKSGGKRVVFCFTHIKEQIFGNTTIESRGAVGEKGERRSPERHPRERVMFMVDDLSSLFGPLEMTILCVCSEERPFFERVSSVFWRWWCNVWWILLFWKCWLFTKNFTTDYMFLLSLSLLSQKNPCLVLLVCVIRPSLLPPLSLSPLSLLRPIPLFLIIFLRSKSSFFLAFFFWRVPWPSLSLEIFVSWIGDSDIRSDLSPLL